MTFQVEWQVLVYDNFDKLKTTEDKQTFEIQTSSLKRGREIAEERASSRVLRKISHQRNGFCVARVIALIDEAGVRYQLPER